MLLGLRSLTSSKMRLQLPVQFEEMAKEIRVKVDVVCNFYQSAEDVPAPRELSSEKKNLTVFDDMLHAKPKNM